MVRRVLALILILAVPAGGAPQPPGSAPIAPVETPSGRPSLPSPTPPAVRTQTKSSESALRVPTALRVERTATTLSVAVDLQSFTPDSITLDPNMIAGVEAKYFVSPEGAARREVAIGLSSAVTFDIGRTRGPPIKAAFRLRGRANVVEIELRLFETDVPPGHHWSPQSPRYRVIWTRTLRQTVD